jgi:hypothetical protein
MVDFENKLIEFRPAAENGLGKMLVTAVGNRLAFSNTTAGHKVGSFVYGDEVASVGCVGELAAISFMSHGDCYHFLNCLTQIEIRASTEFKFGGWTIRFEPGTFESFLGLRYLFNNVLREVTHKEFGSVLNF